MKKILCFGDSITNGARDEYMRNYPLELNHIINGNKKKSICINEGINGETTSGMANRSYKIFEKYANFDMLIFYGGTNDSKIPMPMDVYEKNINYIINVANFFNLKIFLCTLMPIKSIGLHCYSSKVSNNFIKEYNKLLQKKKKIDLIELINTNKLGTKYLEDGVHLTNKGNIEFAKLVYSNVKKYI